MSKAKMTPRSGRGGAGGKRRDPLAELVVIDRLEVGPVELRSDRLRAPYRVHRNGKVDESDLVYRYQERVFEKDDPAALNLASMIAAQVALNYGLFCREIVIHGPLDRRDRQFLEEMLENTSREIYVNKLLQPNPFLLESTPALPAEPRDRFTQAKISFPDALDVETADAWQTDPQRYAVLSSGGKDSLLSFGLLQEIGVEVHPIFGNESGRHWHTALNAYRHFNADVPYTARVWMNSDRLFSWMLRHLPFVRSDFHSLRADQYPIRLWTLAVFAFGAFPLLRKRGLASLVIGDEYDSTVWRRHAGIPHYGGVFDQSIDFDRCVTKYLRSKGWTVGQFSLLRPLSELLIEKTLAERYPELLRFQVSCHATHLEGTRARPCGRCEKCRRIMGMLLAVGQAPSLCGYSDEQVEAAEIELVRSGVHGESEGVEELARRLFERGAIAEARLGPIRARPRPEITQLRFHPRRSPFAEIPEAIRSRVLGALLHHADGAVERQGRVWTKLDPQTDARFLGDGSYDTRRNDHGPVPATPNRRTPSTHVWGELSWPDAKDRLAETDIAILPVGAIEQHGPHLPLDVDSFDANYLALRVAEACHRPRPLVLPLIPFGVSYHHDDFPGTLSVRNESLSAFVHDIGMSLARNGIKKLIILNGHGGNSPALHFAAQMINRDAQIFTCVETGETSDPDIEAMTETRNDVHAGEIETSTSLALRPELVRMDLAKRFVPRFSSKYLDFTHSHSVEWYARTAKISPSGVLGDPSLATASKGDAMWQIMVDRLVEFIEQIKGASLSELYERRY